MINCELIRMIESMPDTMLTLLSGEKILVQESVETVVALTVNYRKRLYQEPIQEPVQVLTEQAKAAEAARGRS